MFLFFNLSSSTKRVEHFEFRDSFGDLLDTKKSLEVCYKIAKGQMIDKIKYDTYHPDGSYQLNTHPPCSTLYNIFERHSQYYEMGMLGSLNSGGDSQFFAKNVTYDNAFDYNKFNSPEHGLNTSNVAYNMSMEDEVESTLDAISNPEEQIVLNILIHVL